MIDLTPKSSERSIQDHLRRYYSLLRANQPFLVSELFDTYRLLRPSLHKKIDSPALDISALNYAMPRLPDCVLDTTKVTIAHSIAELTTAGIDISLWESYSSPARRRKNYYSPEHHHLVILVNSDSDLDDFVNCLICLQIERQKFSSSFGQVEISPQTTGQSFQLSDADWSTWCKILGHDYLASLTQFSHNSDISLQLLPTSDTTGPQTVVADWWHKVSVSSLIFNFADTPIYFISSNLHSVTNLIGGYVTSRQDEIMAHLSQKYPEMYLQWLELKRGSNQLRVADFLYYASSKYFRDVPGEVVAKTKYEESLGIRHLNIKSQLPCDVQLIPVSAITRSSFKDRNLTTDKIDRLQSSKAYIVNIEYPLGFSAYYILTEMLSRLSQLKGVYIIGKAAILSGNIGDIQIPKTVLDERSNNVFNFANVFNQYFPLPAFQTAILQNQKAISVYGTYLENEAQLTNYTKSGFNIIEMESAPYLSAIYQRQTSSATSPHDVVADLPSPGFDLGIINYASDNPLSQTLGDSVMSIKGVEPTYLAALTTIQRIIDLESA